MIYILSNANTTQPIVIGCDHAGVDFKNALIAHLKRNGFTVVDEGCFDNNSVDYPDVAERVCGHVMSGECDRGVLICGTGIGVSMAANKQKGIRAALCHDCYSAKYTRLHNDSNVICFGARVIGAGVAEELLDLFLTTEFEGGRHATRVEKLMKLEQ